MERRPGKRHMCPGILSPGRGATTVPNLLARSGFRGGGFWRSNDGHGEGDEDSDRRVPHASERTAHALQLAGGARGVSEDQVLWRGCRGLAR